MSGKRSPPRPQPEEQRAVVSHALGGDAAAPPGEARPGAAEQTQAELHARNGAKLKAVASLHKLFYEEVRQGCDPNQAAANALLRLAEASREAEAKQ